MWTCQPVLPKWLAFLVGGSGSQGLRAGGASAAATNAADVGGDHRRGDVLSSVKDENWLVNKRSLYQIKAESKKRNFTQVQKAQGIAYH